MAASTVNAAAIALLMLLAAIAQAEMRLVDQTSAGDGSLRYALTFKSRANKPTVLAPEPIPVTDPATGQSHRAVTEERIVDLGVESLLIALPPGVSSDANDWTIEVDKAFAVDGAVIDAAGARMAVAATSVRAGDFRAGQVTIDPAGGPVRLGALELTLTMPAATARNRTSAAGSPGGRIVVDDQARHLAARLFANPDAAIARLEADGESASSIRTASGPQRASAIPPPPGTHRLTYLEGEQLLRINMATVGASAGTIDQLGIVHHGALIPRGGVLGNDVWFFAPRRVTTSAPNDSVFMSMESAASNAMATRNAYTTLAPTLVPVEIAQQRTRRWDQNQRLYPRLNIDDQPSRPIYERSLDRPLGERFPFHRAQNPPSSTALASYTYKLPVLDIVTSTNVTMKAGFNGINQRAINPDHFADITLAGTALPQASFEGIATFYEHTYNITFGAIPAPGYWTLTHSIPAPGGIELDAHNLAHVELTWTGMPRVINNRRGDLSLPAAGAPRKATIAGFPAGTTAGQIYLLDITDPLAPVRLTNSTIFVDSSGGVGVEFEAPATACRFYVERVVSNADIALPNTVALSEQLPEALPAGVPLRAIYVRQSSLATALTPLVNQRGPGILTLEPQAAYNVFNGGQQSPDALRDALRTLIEEAPLRVPVPTVLLVGHGSYDRCNFLNLQTYPQVTFFLDESIRTNGFTVEKSVDYPYSILFGADSLPDVVVGRLPVRDATDLATAVTRLVAHDAATATLSVAGRPALFIADDQAGGDPPFTADQPALVALWAPNGRPNRKMTTDSPSADMGGLLNTAAIDLALEEKAPGNIARGVSHVFYVGHGELNTWGGEQIATSFDTSHFGFLGNFDTTNQWPVVATFTCLNGNYALPVAAATPPLTGRTMVEAWLFNSNRGAIGCIAPVSVEVYDVVKIFQDEYVSNLGRAEAATRPATLGQGWYETQVDILEAYPSLATALREYLLFGDPDALSMVVSYSADIRVTIESTPAVVPPDNIVTFTATAINAGASEARDVEVLVTLPAGISYLASTQAFGTNVPSGQTVLFNFGTLKPGESALGQVIGIVNMGAAQLLMTNAEVSCDFAETQPSDNTASAATWTSVSPMDFMSVR